MFGHVYSHQVTKKYIIMFGNMFNDMTIQRFDSSNNLTQQLTVPIAYGPKEKFLAKISADPKGEKTLAIQLPRMSFEMTNMVYDPSRTLNKLKRNVTVSSKGTGYLDTQFD